MGIDDRDDLAPRSGIQHTILIVGGELITNPRSEAFAHEVELPALTQRSVPVEGSADAT